MRPDNVPTVSILESARRHGLACPRILVSGDMHDELELRLAEDDLADAAFGKPRPAHALSEVITGLLGLAGR